MGYLGTCVVCGEPITDVHDLAWVAPLSLGGPRRRAHAGTCAERAEVQAGPPIEGARPVAWIVSQQGAAVRVFSTETRARAFIAGYEELGSWLIERFEIDEASPSDGERKGAHDGTRG